jgi:AGZA family xanthine/uracil permease-like MFS transporter
MQEKEIKNTAFLTEIRAGLTTFATMAYIIAVNVSYELGRLLSSAGI